MSTYARCASADLRSLIEDAEPADVGGEASFVASGLRAARASRSAHRVRILGDVATALGCRAEELAFLFQAPDRARADSDPVIMPDYRDSLSGPELLLAAE